MDPVRRGGRALHLVTGSEGGAGRSQVGWAGTGARLSAQSGALTQSGACGAEPRGAVCRSPGQPAARPSLTPLPCAVQSLLIPGGVGGKGSRGCVGKGGEGE